MVGKSNLKFAKSGQNLYPVYRYGLNMYFFNELIKNFTMIDVNDWINNECPELVISHGNIYSLITDYSFVAIRRMNCRKNCKYKHSKP